MLAGSYVAIVTPFSNGDIDWDTLAELVEFQIDGGTNGILPCGTTGESPTLSHPEHDQVVEFVVKQVDGRVPVLAGSSSNSTEEALRLTRHARECGAEAALVITPYYNKPTQEGLYRHFRTIAEEVDIPIFIYNVPGRTGVSIAPETVARLSEMKNIVAIKEASGSLEQVSLILSLCDIAVFSGDDSLTFPIICDGGVGVVSVAANIMPKEVSEMVALTLAGRIEEARRLHYALYAISKALFIETNPIPVKTALAMMGKIKEEFRLPLCPMSDSNRTRLEEVLRGYSLI
jgi:4-hydroxy-tetrahydrodipicolinate synthase